MGKSNSLRISADLNSYPRTLCSNLANFNKSGNSYLQRYGCVGNLLIISICGSVRSALFIAFMSSIDIGINYPKTVEIICPK